jgi:hypothetical protein
MRFLIAPLQFVWGMIMCALFLFLSPLIFLAVLLFGIRSMSSDEIDLMKVLLVVLGPFAFDFWWITVRRISGQYRAKRLIAEHFETGDEFSEAELRFLEQVGKPRHLQNLGVLAVSFIGSVYGAHLFYNSGNVQFVLGVLAGIFSPAIVIAAYRFLRVN